LLFLLLFISLVFNPLPLLAGLPTPANVLSSTVSTQTIQPATKTVNFAYIHAQLSAQESSTALKRTLETENTDTEKGLSNALQKVMLVSLKYFAY